MRVSLGRRVSFGRMRSTSPIRGIPVVSCLEDGFITRGNLGEWMILYLGYVSICSETNEKNDFDESIADKLPTGTSLGVKALKMIDASLETDLYSSKPYVPFTSWLIIGGPILRCWRH